MVEVTTQDAQNRLHELLQAEGVDPQAMTVAQYWPVFKQFAAQEFGFNHDNDEDSFMVEYSLPATQSGKASLLHFVRQFTYNDETGLYDRMEQMDCAFYFDGLLDDPEVGSVVLEWPYKQDQYFAQVESLPVFRAALAKIPVRVEWWAGEI